MVQELEECFGRSLPVQSLVRTSRVLGSAFQEVAKGKEPLLMGSQRYCQIYKRTVMLI